MACPTLAEASFGDLLSEGSDYLRQRGLEEAPLEAEVLLMHASAISRSYLLAHGDEPASAEAVAAYRSLLERRARHEPLAYLTGSKEFFGLDFYVDERVLVPRPETETLVEECLKLVRGKGLIGPLLADIGTGCGTIAVALAYHLPEARIYAVDLYAEVLQVASGNCLHHGVQDRVRLLQGHLLEPLAEPVDMIVANLPYIPSSVLGTLAPEIALYEPRLALEGGRDGLNLIRGLLWQASGRLRPGGRLLLEIGADQAAAVVEAALGFMPGASPSLGRASARVVRDLAGRDRVVVIELAI